MHNFSKLGASVSPPHPHPPPPGLMMEKENEDKQKNGENGFNPIMRHAKIHNFIMYTALKQNAHTGRKGTKLGLITPGKLT